MRYLKGLLMGIYIYLGLFSAGCLVWFIRSGTEPTALVAGVFGAAGLESVAGALMKWKEISAKREEEGGEKECRHGDKN